MNDQAILKTFLRLLNHIGISVTGIDAAMAWYRDVFGFRVIKTPVEIIVNSSAHMKFMAEQLFEPRMKHIKLGHMSGSNGVGLEFFQFDDPLIERPNVSIKMDQKFEYTRAVVFHIDITNPNLHDLVRQIVETGGQQINPVLNIFPKVTHTQSLAATNLE